MEIVRAEHGLEFTEFILMNCLDKILLILSIVEETPTLPGTAKLNKALVVIEPNQIHNTIGSKTLQVIFI